jgi:hypothetical protein
MEPSACIDALFRLEYFAEMASKELAPVYEALNWKWFIPGRPDGEDYGIPNDCEIECTIRTLIRSLRMDIRDRPEMCDRNVIGTSTGGITVSVREGYSGCTARIYFEKAVGQSVTSDKKEGE